MTYLLDASALIALSVARHEHHSRAREWAGGVEHLAVCPIVEGALVRFLVRVGEHPQVATEMVRAVHAMARCQFWSDSLSYADVLLNHVQGHHQVTDAYLAGLAASRGGLLATLDQALAKALPEKVLLIPVR